jgi:hypothetical protein
MPRDHERSNYLTRVAACYVPRERCGERPVKKAERAAYIRKKAREMAATGEYSGWLIIEQMLRFRHGLHEARTVLDEQYVRRELDEICKRAQERRTLPDS